MKRWLGVLMAFCMLFTLIPSQVFAADEPTVTIGDAEVTLGSASVSVPVSAAKLNKVAGLIIKVSYPADALSVKEGAVVYGTAFQSQMDNSKNQKNNPLQISFNAGSDREVTYDGKLCDINFDVLSTAKAGDYDITVEIFEATLNGGNEITDDVQVVNGKLTIKDNGGGGSPVSNVAINYVASPTEGGTVSGVTTATAGAEVTVTATPNENYKLVKITAGDTEVTGGKFTVPTGVTSLTVTATFEKQQQDVAINYVASPTEGGTVSGTTTATAGAEVTVTATPNENYKLVKITAGDTEVTGGKFTVPTGVTSLTVTATFEKQAQDVAINYVASPTEGGTVSGATTAKEGAEVTVTATPNENYKLVKITAGDTEVTGGKFTVPTGVTSLTVTATFEKQQQDVAINYVASPTEGGTVSGATTATAGAEVTVTATPKENYELVKITAGDTEVTGGKFTVPTGVTSVTVTATFKQSETEQPDVIYPALTIGNAEATLGTDKTVAVSVSAKSLNKVAGLIIQVTYPEGLSVKEGAVANKSPFGNQTDNAKDGKNPLQISWNAGSAQEVTYEGELCTITFDVLDTAKAGTYDITAKVTDATLNGGTEITDNVTVTKGTLTIKDNGGGGGGGSPVSNVAINYVASPTEGGTVSGATTAKEGAEVTVTATPKENYKLVKITAGDTEVTGGKFTVPTGVTSLTVTATFEKNEEQPKDVAITYVASPTEGGTVSGATTAKEGAEVTVTATPKENYKLVKITAGDTEVTGGKFTVPTGVTSLTVTATFEKNETEQPEILNPALTIGNAEAKLGTDKTVSVPISVKNLSKVAGLIIQVTYPEGLSVKEGAVANKSPFGNQTDNAKDGKNPLQISWNAGSAQEVTYEGELCTITFDVLDTAKAGTHDITAKVTDAALNGGTDITDNVTVTKGTLTITGTPAPGTTEYEIEYAAAQHGKISGVSKSAADKDVAVTVDPDEGYKLDKLTVNGKDVTGTTFKMPAEKATVSATFVKKDDNKTDTNPSTNKGGCYIATSVYGSYDTPEVWTLRRFRDDVLGQTWYGRLFIKAYYATSPTLVRLFGNAEWFQNFWRDKLDTLVQSLQDDGFESTPYQDKDW